MPKVLLPGTVLTIEPGIYFNRVAFTDEAFARYPQVVQAAVEALVVAGFGGVRIEDTYLVTATGCEALSDAPKTVAEIEQIMR